MDLHQEDSVGFFQVGSCHFEVDCFEAVSVAFETMVGGQLLKIEEILLSCGLEIFACCCLRRNELFVRLHF